MGQVRLDRLEDGELISISVAPDARGQGLAPLIIVAACGEANGTVIARIRPDNERSIRAFSRAGFTRADDGDPVVLRWTQGPSSTHPPSAQR